MHETIAVEVVYCKHCLVEKAEGQVLGDHLPPLEEFQRIPPLQVLGDDVVVGAVVEHLEHFDDIGVVLDGS